MNSPDHSFAVRRQAKALRQYLDARHQFIHPEPGGLYKAKATYDAAELELIAAATETVLTSGLDESDATETSPLVARP